MSQLLVFENLKPIEVYNSGNIDQILEKIAQDAKSQKIDISTKKGRDECASLAYKVAQSKTFLDKMGKALGEDARKQLDVLNAERKKCVEFLDKLKDEIRAPLTDWENKEKRRIDNYETEIKNIVSLGIHVETNWQNAKPDSLKAYLEQTKSISHEWEEFEVRAKEAIANTISKIEKSLEKLEKHENEQAELARLREQEKARLQKEHEEKIAFEAAEKAKREAELKAKEESDRVARENERIRLEAEQKAAAIQREKDLAIQKAKEAEERVVREKQLAEQRAKQAAEKAERDKAQAVENERKRIESQKAAEIEAERKRESNRRHVASINNAILESFRTLGVDETLAKVLISAMAKGEVPNVKVLY